MINKNVIALSKLGPKHYGLSVEISDDIDDTTNKLLANDYSIKQIGSLLSPKYSISQVCQRFSFTEILNFAAIARATHGLRLSVVNSEKETITLLRKKRFSEPEIFALLEQCRIAPEKASTKHLLSVNN